MTAKDQPPPPHQQQLRQQQQLQSPQHPTANLIPAQPEAVSTQGQNVESHNTKVARMEADPSHGFGGGIPPKIEEGIE